MSKIEQAVWLGWRQRAEAEKRAAKLTDADIAAAVSDQVGHEVGRALVNHWFRGRREPSLPEFIALCATLGADPGHILLNVRVVHQRLPQEAAAAMQQRAETPDYLAKSARKLRGVKRPRKSKVTS